MKGLTMNDLQSKIYKYLKQGTFADLKIVAKDIAEIAEKEDSTLRSDLIELKNANREITEWNKELQKENAELKAKLFDEMPGKIADICKNKDNLIKELQAKLDNVNALPVIDKERVIKEIEHEQMNLTGVISEIINRCFIDYDKLPKFKDIEGILNNKE
jgi:predicted nuclease with TOPRIM domain